MNFNVQIVIMINNMYHTNLDVYHNYELQCSNCNYDY